MFKCDFLCMRKNNEYLLRNNMISDKYHHRSKQGKLANQKISESIK
jgi:hypothetical protein